MDELFLLETVKRHGTGIPHLLARQHVCLLPQLPTNAGTLKLSIRKLHMRLQIGS